MLNFFVGQKMSLYGDISKLADKIQGGIRGVDYFLYISNTASIFNIGQNANPINVAEFTALKSTIDTLVKNDEFILCKGMPVPPSNVNVVEVPYKGHVLKLPSDRTYDPVDLTFFHTPNQVLYDFFLAWQHLGSNFLAPDGTSSYSPPSWIGADIMLVQTDSTRKIIGGWLLHQAWVSNVGGFDYSAENNDLVEYTVTLQIQKAVRIPVASLDVVKVIPGIFGVNVSSVVAGLQSAI